MAFTVHHHAPDVNGYISQQLDQHVGVQYHLHPHQLDRVACLHGLYYCSSYMMKQLDMQYDTHDHWRGSRGGGVEGMGLSSKLLVALCNAVIASLVLLQNTKKCI